MAGSINILRTRRRFGAAGQLMVLACAWASSLPAGAMPPPPPRAEQLLDLVPNGQELRRLDTVRAYQPALMRVSVQAGDRLLLRLKEADRVLVLQVDTQSGLPWISGAVPGPDGIDIRFAESGVHRLVVLMSANAARAGRAASFELGVRLRR